MAVQEQTPYIEHIANGVTTSFALGFVCDSADNLVVTINDIPTNVGDWSFSDENVVFQYPPLSDSTIKIWRNSPLARSTTFKTYDNSLNPNSLNFDLDKIWLVMQELNVKNFISDNKLQELLDKLVDGDINGLPAEVLARIAGDESIKSLVNLEAIRAYQAESNLSVRIDNESLLANQNILAEMQRAEAAEQSLQIQVNSVGVGNKAYKTYALMDADKATIPAKSKVTVTNDTETSNNGDWQWDGLVFTKSEYDPVQQAKNYTDLEAQKASNYVLSISNQGLYANKAYSSGYKDFADKKISGYISKTTGLLTANTSWCSTDFIAVTDTTKIVRDGLIIGDTSSGCSLACYDVDKIFLGYYIDTAAMFNVKPVDIYPSAKYVRLGYQASSNTKIYVYEPSATAFVDEYVMPFVGKPTNVAGSMTVGYATKTDGSFVALAGWGITDFIAVDATSIVTRDADPVATSSAVAPIACYDENKNYLGYVQNIDRTEKLKIGRKFPNVKFIRMSVVNSSTYALYIQTQSAININDQVKALDIFNADFFASSDTSKGYITLTGAFVASETWITTPLIHCKTGQKFKYTGRGNVSLIANVSLYDKDGKFLESIYAATALATVDLTITNVNAKFVRASAATAYSYAFTGIELAKSTSKKYSTIVPAEVYALKNEPIYLYADGIVGNADNVAWNISESNQKVCKVIPSTSASIPVQLQTTEDMNAKKTLASFNVVVTDTPVNPAAKRYIITLGDSLTDGVANAGIQGAWVNECSRRLSGIGRQILDAELSPSPLNLTNLEFIGTRGSNDVKHEGRGGWRASNYLNNASVTTLTNAFWNPTTSQFDMSYYLTQNEFTGVNATGSNLTLVILLGWNDVYNSTAKQAAIDLGLLIDKIRSTHPNTDIICLGLNQAPEVNFKSFTGNRFISKREVFESIKQFNDEYVSMIATKSNVDFVQISCVFNSEIGYNKADYVISSRSTQVVSGVADHVHPNATGYSMIADAVFYKLLYKYCR